MKDGVARRRVETVIALLLAGGLVAAVVVAVLVLRDPATPTPPAAPPTTTSSTAPASPKPKPPSRLPAALVVKIDNASPARPHTGIGRADAIVVEPVEGGLTRLLAVYWGRRPSTIGPVRSARETDIELLAQLKKPVLAYSGSASELKRMLRRADLVLASPQLGSGGFFRKASRPSPHNMYVNGNRLPKTKPVSSPLRFGKAPAGGKATRSHRVSYRSATYDFTWRGGRWLVSLNGRPMVTTDAGRLKASTVVVQRVKIVRGKGVKDAAGSFSPVARTVGKGKAVVLRDGKRYEGTWSRPKAKQATRFVTTGGKTLSFARGKVWILLVPR